MGDGFTFTSIYKKIILPHIIEVEIRMNKFALMFQEKIVEEVKNVKGDGVGDWPTTEQLQKLGYLERCIKESLRLYPAVPLIARDIKQPVQICKFLKYISKIVS
jgi:hypothetical protein